MEKFFHALSSLGGIRVDNAHDILCGVPEAQAHATTHLNKRGKSTPDNTGFTLVKSPGVDESIHCVRWCLTSVNVLLGLPVRSQILNGLIHVGEVRILGPHPSPDLTIAIPQKVDQPSTLARLQGQSMLQCPTMILRCRL